MYVSIILFGLLSNGCHRGQVELQVFSKIIIKCKTTLIEKDRSQLAKYIKYTLLFYPYKIKMYRTNFKIKRPAQRHMCMTVNVTGHRFDPHLRK